jgi:hypothetical protein
MAAQSTMRNTPRGSTITDTIGKRWEVIALFRHLKDNTYANIARLTKHHPDFVATWVECYLATDNVIGLPKKENRGRKRKLDEAAVQEAAKLMAATQDNPRARVVAGKSTRQAAAALVAKDIAPTVHHTTVFRRVTEDLNLACSKGPSSRMTISPANLPKRLAFAQKHRDDSWKDVLFVDSKIFVMEHAKPASKRPATWAPKGEHLPQPKQRSSAQVHVYAGVSWYGITQLVICTGTTKVKSPYIDPKSNLPHRGVCTREVQGNILPILFADAARMFTPHTKTWRLVLDNPTVHNQADNILPRGVTRVQWPAQGADLNVIENAWAWVDKRLSQKPYSNLAEFAAAMRATWEEVPQKVRRNWIGGMNRRMRAVIRAKGDLTKY